ncbi:GAF domain-containing protein [Sphingomonas jinjuensis]|uniref:GAF domain-containing protein n=1 Tax=Sphingomonas jinjuensis TaxID=535907 RepID=A0A840FDP1_9SPHN|nr:GAF domain-containing protein [Sphingomonas jinjuensis]MBB4154911.1 GAF domain-containing protein [Sphingomonas jinjuensis]
MSDRIGDDETTRLKALDEYRVLDTPPETVFDQLVREAALLTGSPMSTLTMVAGDRQWFKARIGIDHDGDPIERSICAVAIRDDDPLVLPDASRDERFADFTNVKCEGGIRFYAGVPLTVRDGSRLGTLCVLDIEAREQMSSEEIEALDALARRAVAALEMRRDLMEEHGADAAPTNQQWIDRSAMLLDQAAAALTQVGASSALAQLETVVALVADLRDREHEK